MMPTPSLSTVPLKPLFSTLSPKYIYFPTLDWKLECVPPRADNHLLTLSAPRSHQWPPQPQPSSELASGPFPARCIHENTWYGYPAARQVCQRLLQGRREQEDRQTQFGMDRPRWLTRAVAGVIAVCPWLLGTSGCSICSPWISLLRHPGRVGLVCLWGRWRSSGSSEREGNYCAVIQNRNVLQHIYILYIIYSVSYIIYAHIYVEISKGLSFGMTNIFCLHNNSFWLNASLHSRAGLGILRHPRICLLLLK